MAPSLVHVYVSGVGLPEACRLISSDSPSFPTAVFDGGGVNFGGTAYDSKRKISHYFLCFLFLY